MKTEKTRGMGRRGFTIVELSVVLVLLALLITMTVSFSVLIGNYVAKSNGGRKFYEECAELRQTLFDLLLREDDEAITVSVAENELKWESENSVSFADGALTVVRGGASETKQFGGIVDLKFEIFAGAGGDVHAVKCTARQAGEEEDGNVQTFLITLRCGKFEGA